MSKMSSSARISPLVAVVILGGLFVMLLTLTVHSPTSNDLRALWMAGRFFEAGQVYFGSDDVFMMLPPTIWIEALRAEGAKGPVYPFIYPPLWAWVMSVVVETVDFARFAQIASALNTGLVVGSLWLACRIVQPARPREFLLIGAATFLVLLPTIVALEENQPQILVSFLILLGIERARSGSQVVAGLAMALAAALKLYPLIFAMVWWASGDRRAAATFALFGGALGAVSLIVGGWPLHVAFLNEISAISNTIFLTFLNFSADPLMGALLLGSDELSRVPQDSTGAEPFWLFAEKSSKWRFFNALSQLAFLAMVLWMSRRTQMRNPLLWPGVIFLVAWLSPLSWTYHYLTMFAFLPAIADRLGMRLGLLLVLIICFPSSLILYQLPGLITLLDLAGVVLLTNATLLLAGGLFLWLGSVRTPDTSGISTLA